MKKNLYILICAVLLLQHCGCNKKNSIDTVDNEAILLDSIFDEIKLVQEFLNFYSENYNDIYSNNFVDYNQEYYRIDFKNTELFLEKIKIEKYFTQQFEKSLVNHFKKIDKTLETEKQNDGIPEGLNYDLILFTQDIDELIDIIKNSKYEMVKLNENTIKVNFENIHELLFFIEKDKIKNISLP